MQTKWGANRSRPSRSRLTARVLVAVSLASLVAACGSSGSSGGSSPADGQSTGGATSDKPLKLYALTAETGAAAAYSGATLDGLKSAVNTINTSGGVLGRKIDLTVVNDATDPTKAVSLVQSQIESDKPDIVFGGSSSGEILPVSQVTNAAKIFTLSVGADPALADASRFPYTFGVLATLQADTASTADYLKSKGYKRIGLISSTDAVGVSFTATYKVAIHNAGLDLVGSESFDPTAVDMTAQFERLKSGDPDALVVVGIGTAGYLMKSREKAGMLNVPTVSDSANQAVDWTKATTKAQQQNVVMMVYKCNVSTSKSPGITSLMASLKNQGVTLTRPILQYADGSDILLSWANAAITVKSFDPDKIKEALESGNYTKKYPTAIAEDYGWTASSHLNNSVKNFLFIAPTPITDGQHVVGG